MHCNENCLDSQCLKLAWKVGFKNQNATFWGWFLSTVRLFCPKPRLTIISMFTSPITQNVYFQEVSDEQLRDLEKQRQEHKLGVLLVGISILFICCQSFKIIPDVYEILFCPDMKGECVATPFIEFCVNLSHLLVCFNSAANFIIYLLGGEKFRRAWCQTYLCRKADNPRNRYVVKSVKASMLDLNFLAFCQFT